MKVPDLASLGIVGHLVLNFLFERVKKGCIDELTKGDYFLLVEESDKVIAEASHFAISGLKVFFAKATLTQLLLSQVLYLLGHFLLSLLMFF